jgi:hypothetical protein
MFNLFTKLRCDHGGNHPKIRGENLLFRDPINHGG